MRDVRRLVGILGLVMLALGFYALIEVLINYANGYGLGFVSLAQFLADIGLGDYMHDGLLASVEGIPAFFSLTLAGVVIAWWGLKRLPPKPKFRKG